MTTITTTNDQHPMALPFEMHLNDPSDHGVYEGLIGMYEDIQAYEDMIHPPGLSVAVPVHPASQSASSSRGSILLTPPSSPLTVPPSSPELSPARDASSSATERSKRAVGSLYRFPRASVRIANDQIAFENGALFRQNPQARLEPLRQLCNGKLIPEFPDTLSELRTLNKQNLDRICKVLRSDLDPEATADEVKVEWISRQWVCF